MKPEKRSLIMKAMEDIIKNKRYSEVTMESIAIAAGVGKGTIYRYFKDKEDLFFEFFLNGSEELAQEVNSINEKQMTFRDKFRYLISRLEMLFSERHIVMQVMNQQQILMNRKDEDSKNRFRQHRIRIINEIGNIIQSGFSDGSIESDLSSEQVACIIVDLIIGRMHRPEGVQPLELSQMINFVLKGLQNGTS